MATRPEIADAIERAARRLPGERLHTSEIARMTPYNTHQVGHVLGIEAKKHDPRIEVSKVDGSSGIWEFQPVQDGDTVAYVMLESLERGTLEVELGPGETFQEANDEPSRITVITNDR